MHSGFRKGLSTSTALLEVDNILNAQYMGLATILTLLDFSGALDSVSIPLLLAKLNYYGFDIAIVKFFSSYLTDSTQIVKIQELKGHISRSSVRGKQRHAATIDSMTHPPFLLSSSV